MGIELMSLGKRGIARTDTVVADEGSPTFATPDSPASKKPKTKREKIAYATTTVLRSLDEVGDQSSVPLINSLRSASFHTRKVLQQQLQKEKQTITPEIQNAKAVLALLARAFTEIEGYDYSVQAPSHKWKSKKDLKEFQELLSPLCKAAKEVLEKDKMLVKLTSPCYVLGDLHGNYKDLQFFRSSFWNMGVDMSPARFLFLGDYVDRGPHSVELTAYLFAIKIIYPNRVFLLRGNHEFRAQNGERDYDPCFLQNFEQIFAKKTATKLWEEFNNTFEFMPLTATIDDKIFCCHGGIPRIIQNELKPNQLVQWIKQIERPLKDDEVDESEDFIALDILWSDPATEEEEQERINQDESWFGENDRGGDIVVFGKKAVEEFVKHTGFTHIIRAHQPPKNGIEYCKAARIITVFSSSHYCGGFNSAAIVLVNEGRLRVATTKPAVQPEEEGSDSELEDVIAEEDY